MIYIVDDDPSVRRSLKRLLHTVGAEVETSASAQEFLNCWDPLRQCCLIFDIYLKGMNGIQLYEQLLESGYRIPVIFISAQDNEWIHAAIGKIGGAGFLRKPFEDHSLFEAINKVTGRSL